MAKSCFRGASGGSIPCPSLHTDRVRAQEENGTVDVPVLGTFKCCRHEPKKAS